MNDTLELPRGVTAAFAKSGLAEGTNSGTIKIAAPNGAGVDFAIKGIAYHKADTDNIAVTAHAAQAVLTKCLYLVQIDKDGTVSTKKGNEELTADLTAGKRALHWPAPDVDVRDIRLIPGWVAAAEIIHDALREADIWHFVHDSEAVLPGHRRRWLRCLRWARRHRDVAPGLHALGGAAALLAAYNARA